MNENKNICNDWFWLNGVKTCNRKWYPSLACPEGSICGMYELKSIPQMSSDKTYLKIKETTIGEVKSL